ncbi:LAME_0B04984g1_1 [Lachancea meyersii CBS 8951]|uniref:LAME_0B04984g1_1 n=1 Tax=Lachancea meyersii CBS 8951 TaxID=1266667 RepID=A0A1G4IVU0_9SACH|nr:LAME_0B04984g1_1 [Lachancea meyersii CBS 8951]
MNNITYPSNFTKIRHEGQSSKMKCGAEAVNVVWRGYRQSIKNTMFSRRIEIDRRTLHSYCRLLVNETQKKPLFVSSGLNDAEKRLEKNPEFQKLSGAFEDSNHQHIHMSESETLENDLYQLGTGLYRESDHHRRFERKSPASQNNTMLVLSKSQIKTNPGVRITWIGLLINVGMAAGKFAGGIVFHSQALTADAVHALSDLVSDFLTLFSIGWSSKLPTKQYPLGYGKIQTLGTLSVSAILAVAGLSIGWGSLCAIAAPFLPDTVMHYLASHSHSHVHGSPDDVTNINAAWIAAGSIAVKEWIFNATKKVAKETKSNVLLANAWHHRVDSLTSLVALVTISSGYFFNIQSLDAVGGLLVSGLVVKAGADGLIVAVTELMDKSVSKTDVRYIGVEKNLTEILAKMVSNNNAGKPYKLKDLVVLASGPSVHAKMVLEVPIQRWENLLTVKELENVTHHVRSTLIANMPSLVDLNVEFVEEKPALSLEQEQELERQRKMGTPPLPRTEASEDPALLAGSHTHSHFGGLGELGHDHDHDHDHGHGHKH